MPSTIRSAAPLARDDGVVFRKGFGVASVESREPVTLDTVFRIASTTKMLTAAALAALEEQGKVRFDAPIDRYVRSLDPEIDPVDPRSTGRGSADPRESG